jgi:nucleoside-diphosphate-sugar epimerase
LKILLTGPAGFVGSSFLNLALSHGHQVAGLFCPQESPPSALRGHPGLTSLRGTLAEAPWPEIAAFAPEVCVHTAWITTPGIYLEAPENHRFLEWSLDFLQRVTESGTGRVVVLGTCIEYQIGNHPLSETSTLVSPTTLYAQCKNSLRIALETEPRFHSVATCWCRLFYPYGIGEHPSRLCSSIIQKVARSENILLKTPDSTKDYIYIDDVAAALMIVVEKGFRGTINLGTGAGIPVKSIATTIARLMNKPELVQLATHSPADPLGWVVADASRLEAMGWRPQITLLDGLTKLIKHLAP